MKPFVIALLAAASLVSSCSKDGISPSNKANKCRDCYIVIYSDAVCGNDTITIDDVVNAGHDFDFCQIYYGYRNSVNLSDACGNPIQKESVKIFCP